MLIKFSTLINARSGRQLIRVHKTECSANSVDYDSKTPGLLSEQQEGHPRPSRIPLGSASHPVMSGNVAAARRPLGIAHAAGHVLVRPLRGESSGYAS